MTDVWGDPDPERVWRPPARPETPPGDPGGWPPPPGSWPDAWVPPVQQPREPLGPRLRAAAYTILGTVPLVVLLGAPVAFLWRAVAPDVAILHTASGPQPVAPESSQVFGVDGWFVVVTLLAGLVTGGLAWLWLRRSGPAGVVALATGGLLAALVTDAVGRKIVTDRYLYDFCHRKAHCLVYSGTLRLHATAAVVFWPAAALAVFALLTLVRQRED